MEAGWQVAHVVIVSKEEHTKKIVRNEGIDRGEACEMAETFQEGTSMSITLSCMMYGATLFAHGIRGSVAKGSSAVAAETGTPDELRPKQATTYF